MSEHSVVILNVNDDPATRYVISHALRQSGYQVREAVNGAEALACVPSCDLVLLDIQLPDMDGFEVCRRIREQTAPRWLPVIHVSGVFVEDDHHVESLQGGADAYLTYPIPPNVLRATISAFLRVRAVEQRLVYEKARAEEDLFSVIAEARCLLWRAEVLETGAPFVRWRVQVCDEQAAQRFFPVNQVAGCSYAQAWYEARPLEDRVRTDTFASAEVRAGRSYSQEYRCRRQDGELRWMREDVRIETIGPGSWRAVGVCLDVTEQKRYEQVLAARASLAALRSEIAGYVSTGGEPDAVLGQCVEALAQRLCTLRAEVWLQDESHQHLVRHACAGHEAALDNTPDPIRIGEGELGRVLTSSRPCNTRAEAPPAAADQAGVVSSAGMACLAAYPLQGDNGSFGVLAVHTAHELSDATLDALGTIADQLAFYLERRRLDDERRLLEAQLRQSQKMEAVGQLAGGIAHDFNNMLAVISGYSELLLQQLDPAAPAACGLQEIHRAAERAADLTRQLLAFSRKQLLEPKILDPNEMVRDTERILRRLIGENIELHVVLDPDVGLIRADPTQLDQVILNLAVNARDAMPTGGRLQVSTAQVSVGSGSALARVDVPPGRYALLEVADSGSGIEPAILGKIWEPFFTTKAVGKGTGLGLATVYGIVSQSGGHIVVRSTPGEGTTFGVYFPRVDEAVSEPDAPATKAASGVETVLMVEDEPMVRCLVRTVLEQAGYRVLEAGCGEEALEVAADYPDYIDLLLTDVVIPGKTNGRLLADTLCAERKGLRVLYMSGYTDDAVLAQGIQQAEVAFLQKPFGPAVLAARVREVLDEGGPRDGA